MINTSRRLTDQEVDAISQDDAIKTIKALVRRACGLFDQLERHGKWTGDAKVSIAEITDVVESEILNYWNGFDDE